MAEIDLALLRPVLHEHASQGRTALLPVLHATQAIYGYLPEAVAAEIGQALGIPLADVYGVIDFYAHFYSAPVAKQVVQVCNDPVCALAGSDALMKMMARRIHLDANRQVTSVTLERAPCLGLCEHAPAVLVDETQRGHVVALPASAITATIGQTPVGVIGGESALLTRNCGQGRVTSLADYAHGGGYAALRQAVQRPPGDVIAEVKAAGLVGRGGAAFPTGLKWESAAQASGSPKYVVCNGDEAEPGTFKDRVIMEEDPHQVLEGLILAAYAIGASQGYVFIRAEYPRALETMSAAVVEARQTGYLGAQILGTHFSFDVELRRGAGAYICGEETALFEAIEGKRGFPRMKPPFPTTAGLFGRPTVINNVETLCNVPLILRQGAAAYRQLGTAKSPGPKLFCLSGDVQRPGLYEVPFGVSIRHLLHDLAGGLRAGHRLQALLLGGAAGAFATEQALDVRLSFEDLRAAGLPLGSGVITVLDETRDLRDVVLRLARFFAEESCGKCFPCQLGTQRQFEILQRVARGQAQPGDADRLREVGQTMSEASLCGLGQTAASAVLSALQHWPHLFAAAH
jgi:NADH-quinone oxidoreductase subunit F